MAREHYNDLRALLIVARERSFTKAAAQMGVSQAALSYTVRELEQRLGIRLLTRTTRSVTPTEAGQRLLAEIAPHFASIDIAVDGLGELRDRPSGTLRINSSDHASELVLWPKLRRLLDNYPEINIEVVDQSGLTDIVAEGFDIGIRMGEQVAKDMIAVPISPPLSMAVVATPTYFKRQGIPRIPQDLTAHDCINMRLMTQGGLYAWEFEKDGRSVNVRVEGRLTLSSARLIAQAALDGRGLACVPDLIVAEAISDKRLKRVMLDWCPAFPGYHLYYPSRRQNSPAFALLVEALRWDGVRR
ncbi:DNA-binding transcriptional LysR family regulator [Luteibacter sp. Sphag1AF]|uniref:LysR family transcriptional regulator n=1 Tax=Luteibacter sp. Sphag1AF TaxID=2587031 RepID=UPI001616B328|nr:LysR family transcriptional regulator [Luteibacter sp. Sphag1AF]MBB3228698.1 DNA-binding transcriptional LysR family regulator [Luteibacter sp. Sphag1AF]